MPSREDLGTEINNRSKSLYDIDKILSVSNTLAYFTLPSELKKTSLTRLDPGVNVKNLFLAQLKEGKKI